MMKMTRTSFLTLKDLADGLVNRVDDRLGRDLHFEEELELYLFVGTTFRAQALPEAEYQTVVQQLTDAADAVAAKMNDGASVAESLQGDTPFCLQPEPK